MFEARPAPEGFLIWIGVFEILLSGHAGHERGSDGGKFVSLQFSCERTCSELTVGVEISEDVSLESISTAYRKRSECIL